MYKIGSVICVVYVAFFMIQAVSCITVENALWTEKINPVSYKKNKRTVLVEARHSRLLGEHVFDSSVSCGHLKGKGSRNSHYYNCA